MELDEIIPEKTTHKPKNLEESMNLLAESSSNLMSSKESDDLDPYIITDKRNSNVLNELIDLFNKEFNKAKIKNKILIIIAMIINVLTLLIKIYISFIMLFYLVKRIKILHNFIMERILDNVSNKYILYIINYIFLVFGFIILFIEIICQFNIRTRTLLTINECSLKSLILSKCLYFISLGLVPEVIFATVPFKSKKNVFLSFFKVKFITQPYIIFIIIIYALYTICKRKEETRKDRIFKEIKDIKKIINEFVNKYIFVWNQFNEKIIIEKDKEKNKEKKEEDEISTSSNITEEKNIINIGRNNTLPNIIRRKRKDIDNDDDNNKTNYQKLLRKNDEEDNGEDEEKKGFGIIKKFKSIKNRLSLFWNDNIFTRIKKYAILGIVGFFLCSPIINGIFGYGYYVFYESDVYRCFQIELILCFVFGFILILLTDE